MRAVPHPNQAPPSFPAGEPTEHVPASEEAQEYPLVLCLWHDAFFDFQETDPEDCRDDYVVRTVGYLVNEGPRFLSIAQELLPDEDGFRAVTHIPRSIVESIVHLYAGPFPVPDQPAS
ncbi:MAG: hypothetical protein QOI81_66 [Actinomycetota bacterium]|nr:hypothetical protein [Actinomycetota bacterium]MEA2550574.1 hypothetical protein [Actinomycetota bacterium]